MSTVDINAKGNVSIFGDVVGRDKITINLPPPLPPAEAKDRANLLILLSKVKTFWIEGVLEKSVHNAVLLELGKETKPEAVDHPWGMVLELPDQTNQVLPSGTKIIDIFEKMNRALLILGEPGSGKTITLLELARDLIIRAEADQTQPIPVVFNLSSWTDKRQLLVDWLVFELSTKYQIPKSIGRTWLKDNRLLPLFDGLDEVKSENRAACVEAISHFGETFGLPGRVVCCRIREYTALQVRLKLNGAICLQPLTLTHVNSYLEAGGSKLDNLHSALQNDEALQKLAQSPLMLSIMSLVYQDESSETLPYNYNNTEERLEGHRKHLFDTYIEGMFKRKGKVKQPYTIGQTISRLSWLAQNLCRHSQTLFLVEQLQPSWLSNSIQRWIYVFSSRIFGVSLVLFFILSMRLPAEDTSLELVGLLPISGLIWGLSAALIDTLRFERNLLEIKKAHTTWQAMIYILIYGMVPGLLIGWLNILEMTLIDRLSEGLICGLFGGLIFGLRGRRQTVTHDIQTVETLSWSWINTLKGSIRGLILGLLVGLIIGYVGLIEVGWPKPGEERFGLFDFWDIRYRGLWIGLFGGLFGGLIGAIWGGLKFRVVETKNYPNQGMRLSLKNAALSGLIVGFIIGGGMSFALILEQSDVLIGLQLGLVVGILAALWYGGLDVFQHYTLRFILCCKRYTPWNYARFLDYTTSLIFLKKVGGGYIFIHRLLLEHFAAMPLQSKTHIK